MKTENVVLFIGWTFVLLVVIGLSCQSCRSVSSFKTGKDSLLTKTCNEVELITDSAAHNRLLTHGRDYSFVIDRQYEPVFDSTGNVIGNRIVNERIDAKGKELLNAFEKAVKMNSISRKDSSTQQVKVSSTEKETQKKPPDFVVFFFMFVMLCLIGLIFKKK